jgi:hypothetical protein
LSFQYREIAAFVGHYRPIRLGYLDGGGPDLERQIATRAHFVREKSHLPNPMLENLNKQTLDFFSSTGYRMIAS